MAARLVAFALACFLSAAAGAATIRNDDGCDIALLPAATLLLPYFEVDVESDPPRATTIFTITNVTNADQVARLTLWTDYGFPVISVNIYLTGYDAQTIDLYDVIARGIVAPDAGTGTGLTRRGVYSDVNTALDLTPCDRLPGYLDELYVLRMRDAFTRGSADAVGSRPACDFIGGEHDNAVGYATIDIVRTCTNAHPADPDYWKDLRYDNALIGDYEQVGPENGSSTGSPMVHIRAVPEGGGEARFERTFYSRYQHPAAPGRDGRQPLPSTFAARWIAGGPEEFETFLKIWREGRSGATTNCGVFAAEARRRVAEIVVFDENENLQSFADAELPSTSKTSITDDDVFPRLPNGGTAGWVYLNLDRVAGDAVATQGWVVSSMRAQNRFAVDVDAAALGNGCAPPTPRGEVALAKNSDADNCDIAQMPAATLLLPYFEVDAGSPPGQGETTLFTITNVGEREQIARVTLWTDGAYPVLTFNVPLAGYDVQSINLYDVLRSGILPGAAMQRRGCDALPRALSEEVRQQLVSVLESGKLPGGCAVGRGPWHNDHAVGYATVDVVGSCSSRIPTDPAYWTEDLRYDNVLIGDYQQLDGGTSTSYGSPLVHIRAVRDHGATPLPRTFYARFQDPASPHLDARQPLPTTFAARWKRLNTRYNTYLKIWREAKTGPNAPCDAYGDNDGIVVADMVVFDDAENAYGLVPYPRAGPPGPHWDEFPMPATSAEAVGEATAFPQLTNGAVSGWLYLNLDNDRFDESASSNWVIVSRRDAGRSFDFDAIALGNGCSPPVARSEVENSGGTVVIGPAPNPP